MRFVEHCTDEELVRELVKRAKDRGRLQSAPDKTTRHTPHSSVLIGIGTDHTADLVLDDDAVDILLHGRRMA